MHFCLCNYITWSEQGYFESKNLLNIATAMTGDRTEIENARFLFSVHNGHYLYKYWIWKRLWQIYSGVWMDEDDEWWMREAEDSLIKASNLSLNIKQTS